MSVLQIHRPMRNFVVIITAVIFSITASAQPAIQWQKCFGGSGSEWPYSIQQTSDKGFIVAGFSDSTSGDVSGWHAGYDPNGHPLPDYWILKLDSNADLG